MPPKKTATKDETTEQQIPDHAETREVAVFSPPRLPYHDAVQDRFGVDKGQWKVLVEAIFPAAKSVDAIVMALSYCKSRNLDPFKRPVHIVPMWDSARGGYVETVWPGISELRTTASRTEEYAGIDEAEFGPTRKVKFAGRVKANGAWKDETVEVEFPDWCRLTVYRIVDGQRCKFVGPKVKWEETYATIGNSDIPNKMWQERPEGQIEKCAEAAALRRAFPEEIGNELTAEEMTGRNIHDHVITTEAAAEPAGAPPAEPPPTSGQAGARDAAPPRRVATPVKEDPISTGPIKTNSAPQKDAAPPRQATSAPKSGAAAAHHEPARTRPAPPPPPPPPTKRVTAPSHKEPDGTGRATTEETKPHKIPGTGHSFASWAAKYCDLIATSTDTAAVYKWIDLNSDPLGRLAKGSPADARKCTDTAKRVIDELKTQQEAPSGQMDEGGGDMSDGEAPEWPTDPEAQLKHIDQLLSQANAETLESIWDDMIAAGYDTMFPPDKEEAMAIYRKHEARVAP